jgi:hypothetical protein
VCLWSIDLMPGSGTNAAGDSAGKSIALKL